MALDERIFSFAATSVVDQNSTYVYGHDITDRKQAESEIVRLRDEAMHKATHDQLTGLPNRLQLAQKMEQASTAAQGNGSSFALLMIDIDNFKSVNDGLGHDAGDQLIVLISQTLRSNLRHADFLCRWGGDELLALLNQIEDPKDVAKICERLRQAVLADAAVWDFSVPISISVGYAIYPKHGRDTHVLMQQADQALYDAKRAGRNCWREFNSFAEGDVQQSPSSLLFRLGKAVQGDRLLVHFHPLIDARSGRLVSVEALARWHDDDLGWVGPNLFIPLAEKKGLIIAVGEQITRKALTSMRRWHDHNWPLSIGINVSRQQLQREDFTDRVLKLVSHSALSPEYITWEITERDTLLGHPICRRNIEQLARHGFTVSLDDFGAGFSTLELLCEFPFHELKLSQGLIKRFENVRVARTIESMVHLGQSLGLSVVAEGVETKAQRSFLIDIGVNKLQGFLYSRPLDESALEHYLVSLSADQAVLERDDHPAWTI